MYGAGNPGRLRCENTNLCGLISANIGFNLQPGLSVMVDEYGQSTCNCYDSAMGYSKENQTCFCQDGGYYIEKQAKKPF